MKTTCIIVALAAFLVVESLGAGDLQRQIFECQSGVPYLQNDCNPCFCVKAADSDLLCTVRRCPHIKDKDVERCSTGTTWQKDCNTCWCVNIGTVCTNYDCNSNDA